MLPTCHSCQPARELRLMHPNAPVPEIVLAVTSDRRALGHLPDGE